MRGGSASGTETLELQLPAQITLGGSGANTRYDFIRCNFEFNQNQNRLTKVVMTGSNYQIDVGDQIYVAHDPKRARPEGRCISIEFPQNKTDPSNVRKIVVNAGNQYDRVKRLLGEENWKSWAYNFNPFK